MFSFTRGAVVMVSLHRHGVSHLGPEFTTTANHTSQLAPGIPGLPSDCRNNIIYMDSGAYLPNPVISPVMGMKLGCTDTTGHIFIPLVTDRKHTVNQQLTKVVDTQI